MVLLFLCPIFRLPLSNSFLDFVNKELLTSLHMFYVLFFSSNSFSFYYCIVTL